MRKLGSLLAIAACLPLAGCFTVVTPAMGMLYADVKWDGGVANGAIGAKTGTACARSILGMFSQGDASIQAAANNGGIKTVTTVDHHTKNMFGVIGDYCTTVRGN
ncbi:MAG TPA: TRL-like family protein [Myxococcota bacterium]|jgi:hypothetical protein|nr:TRL-like family protein [Myxococcota bacterium]